MAARSTREPTVGAMQALDIMTALVGLGLDRRRLCAEAGFDATAADHDEARVPVRVVSRLFAVAERLAGDDSVGLHVGERLASHDPLDYLLMSSGRLEDGLRAVGRVSRLLHDTLHIDLLRSGDAASVIVDVGGADAEADRHSVECILVESFRSIRHAIGDAFALTEVHVRHDARRREAELRRAFGCVARSLAAQNRLVFPARHLASASRLANPEIAAQLERFALQRLAGSDPGEPMRERVSYAVRTLLAAGRAPRLAAVARMLSRSERSVARALAEEGLSFRTLRDRALCEASIAMLGEPEQKIESIALALGFADVAAFSKAFKRWTGRTAKETRERALRPRGAPA